LPWGRGSFAARGPYYAGSGMSFFKDKLSRLDEEGQRDEREALEEARLFVENLGKQTRTEVEGNPANPTTATSLTTPEVEPLANARQQWARASRPGGLSRVLYENVTNNLPTPDASRFQPRTVGTSVLAELDRARGMLDVAARTTGAPVIQRNLDEARTIVHTAVDEAKAIGVPLKPPTFQALIVGPEGEGEDKDEEKDEEKDKENGEGQPTTAPATTTTTPATSPTYATSTTTTTTPATTTSTKPTYQTGLVPDRPQFSTGLVPDRPQFSTGLVPDRPQFSTGLVPDQPTFQTGLVADHLPTYQTGLNVGPDRLPFQTGLVTDALPFQTGLVTEPEGEKEPEKTPAPTEKLVAGDAGTGTGTGTGTNPGGNGNPNNPNPNGTGTGTGAGTNPTGGNGNPNNPNPNNGGTGQPLLAATVVPPNGDLPGGQPLPAQQRFTIQQPQTRTLTPTVQPTTPVDPTQSSTATTPVTKQIVPGGQPVVPTPPTTPVVATGEPRFTIMDPRALLPIDEEPQFHPAIQPIKPGDEQAGFVQDQRLSEFEQRTATIAGGQPGGIQQVNAQGQAEKARIVATSQQQINAATQEGATTAATQRNVQQNRATGARARASNNQQALRTRGQQQQQTTKITIESLLKGVQAKYDKGKTDLEQMEKTQRDALMAEREKKLAEAQAAADDSKAKVLAAGEEKAVTLRADIAARKLAREQQAAQEIKTAEAKCLADQKTLRDQSKVDLARIEKEHAAQAKELRTKGDADALAAKNDAKGEAAELRAAGEAAAKRALAAGNARAAGLEDPEAQAAARRSGQQQANAARANGNSKANAAIAAGNAKAAEIKAKAKADAEARIAAGKAAQEQVKQTCENACTQLGTNLETTRTKLNQAAADAVTQMEAALTQGLAEITAWTQSMTVEHERILAKLKEDILKQQLEAAKKLEAVIAEKRGTALAALDKWKAETDAEIAKHKTVDAELQKYVAAQVVKADQTVAEVEQKCQVEIKKFSAQADQQIATRKKVFEQQRDRGLQQVERIMTATAARIAREDQIAQERIQRTAENAKKNSDTLTNRALGDMAAAADDSINTFGKTPEEVAAMQASRAAQQAANAKADQTQLQQQDQKELEIAQAEATERQNDIAARATAFDTAKKEEERVIRGEERKKEIDRGQMRQAAEKLYYAMKGGTGWGTDEDAIREALAGRTPEEIAAITAEYEKQHGAGSLRSHLDDELGGDDLKSINLLMSGDQAKQAAGNLIYGTTSGMFGAGTDRDLVAKTLEECNDPAMRRMIAEEYQKATGRSIDDMIKSESSGIEADYFRALAAGDKDTANAALAEEAMHGGKFTTFVDWVAETTGQDRNAARLAWGAGQYGANGTDEEALRKIVDSYRNENDEVMTDAERAAASKKEAEGLAAMQAAYAKRNTGLDGKSGDLRKEIEEETEGAEQRMITYGLDQNWDAARAARYKAAIEGNGTFFGGIGTDVDAAAAAFEGTTERQREAAMREVDRQAGLYGGQTMAESLDAENGEFGTMDLERMRQTTDKGKMDPGFELLYSMDRAGTDEQRIKDVLAGKSKEEIKALEEEYAKYTEKFGGTRKSLRDDLEGELSGDDHFDVFMMMRGKPENAREEMEQENLRHQYNRQGFGNTFADLYSDDGKRYDAFNAEMNAQFADLEAKGLADIKYKELSPDQRAQFDDFLSTIAVNETAGENQRKTVDAATNAVAMTATVVVGAVVTVATVGTLGPAAAAAVAAVASGLSSMAIKTVMLGGRYGLEDAGVDLATTVVSACTAGLVQSSAMNMMVQRMVVAMKIPPGIIQSITRNMILEAGAGALGGLSEALMNEEAYRGDLAHFLAFVGTQTGSQALGGMASGFSAGLIERGLSKTVDGQLVERTLLKNKIANAALREGIEEGFTEVGATLMDPSTYDGRFEDQLLAAGIRVGQAGIQGAAMGGGEAYHGEHGEFNFPFRRWRWKGENANGEMVGVEELDAERAALEAKEQAGAGGGGGGNTNNTTPVDFGDGGDGDGGGDGGGKTNSTTTTVTGETTTTVPVVAPGTDNGVPIAVDPSTEITQPNPAVTPVAPTPSGLKPVNTPSANPDSFSVNAPGFNSAGSTFGGKAAAAVDTVNAQIESGALSGDFQSVLGAMAAQRQQIAADMGETGADLENFGKPRPDGSLAITPLSNQTGDATRYGPWADKIPPVMTATLSNGEQVVLTKKQTAAELAAELGIPESRISAGGQLWIVHTSPDVVQKVLAEVDALYQRALDPKLSPEETIRLAGEIHWWMAHAMPFGRGSAAITDMLVKSILLRKGIEAGPWAEGVVPDMDAFTVPSAAEFGNQYAGMMSAMTLPPSKVLRGILVNEVALVAPAGSKVIDQGTVAIKVGDKTVTVKLAVGKFPGDAPAKFDTTEGGFVIILSEKVPDADAMRVIAHQMVLVQRAAMAQAGIALPDGSPSPELAGRSAELKVLFSQLDASGTRGGEGADVGGATAGIDAVLQSLGLDSTPDGIAKAADLLKFDPKIAQRVQMHLAGFGPRTALDKKSDLGAFVDQRQARLDALAQNLTGEHAGAMVEVEGLALGSQLKLEEGHRLFDGATKAKADPTATGDDAKAQKAAEKAVNNHRAAMVATLNNPHLSTAQRQAQLLAQIDAMQADPNVDALAALINFDAMRASAKAMGAHDGANGENTGAMTLDVSSGQLKVPGSDTSTSLRSIMDKVDQANRAAAENGLAIEYVLVVHRPAKGADGKELAFVEILARRKPQSYIADTSAQKLPGNGGEGDLTVDVGVGRGGFAVELATIEQGGLLVQTDYIGNAELGQMKRGTPGISDAGPVGGPGSVMVFTDFLMRPDMFTAGQGDGVNQVFINNVSAHLQEDGYAQMAEQLAATMAEGGTIEIQWTDSPEKVGGKPGSRGHVNGTTLAEFLKKTGRSFTVVGPEGVPIVGDNFTLDAAKNANADPDKVNDFVPPKPDFRVIIKFGPPLTTTKTDGTNTDGDGGGGDGGGGVTTEPVRVFGPGATGVGNPVMERLDPNTPVFRVQSKSLSLSPHDSPFFDPTQYNLPPGDYEALYMSTDAAELEALRRKQGYFDEGGDMVMHQTTIGEILAAAGPGAIVVQDAKFNASVLGREAGGYVIIRLKDGAAVDVKPREMSPDEIAARDERVARQQQLIDEANAKKQLETTRADADALRTDLRQLVKSVRAANEALADQLSEITAPARLGSKEARLLTPAIIQAAATALAESNAIAAINAIADQLPADLAASVRALASRLETTYGLAATPTVVEPKTTPETTAAETVVATNPEGPQTQGPVLVSKANGDPDAAKIEAFANSLPTYELPAEPSQLTGVVQSILAAQVGSTEGLTVAPLDNGGLHQGHTGAKIFLIKDANGELKYVAKITTNIEDAVREISGLTLMGGLGLEHFGSTKPIGSARLVGADGTTAIVSLAEGAPGKPLVKLVETIGKIDANDAEGRAKATAHLEAALDAYAKALAELHDKAPHEDGKADTRAYERYFKFNDTTIDQLAGSKAIPEFWSMMGYGSLADLKARVAEVTAAAMANPGNASFIHGDTNPGNEFFADDGSVTFIDASTVPLGVNEVGNGIAPVGRDITSLAVFLEETVFEVGLSPEEGIRLRTLFEQSYRAYRGGNFSEASEGDSIRFFEMRAALKALVHTPAAIAAHTDPSPQWVALLEQRLDMLARALGAPKSSVNPNGPTKPNTTPATLAETKTSETTLPTPQASTSTSPLINLAHKPTDDQLLVCYRVVPEPGVSIESIAANLAIESSTGTWTDVGVDPERIAPFNPTVYSIQLMPDGGYAVKIAYPATLFEAGNIAQIWAAIGGDVFGLKGMKSLRLKDISFSDQMLDAMPGPSHGIAGTREQMGLEGRPVLGNIFKPKFGMTIDEMRQLALDAYLGGLDQLKDDEVMTSQAVIDFDARVRAVLSAVKEAEVTTGQKKVYVANVTAATYEETAARAALVQSLGGTHIMIDGFTSGVAIIQSLRQQFPGLVIQVHRAGHAAVTRSKDHGIDMEVLAKMYRAAGGDLIAVGTPPGIGKMPTNGNDVSRIEDATTRTMSDASDLSTDGYELPERWGDMNPAFAVVSGGLHPATIYELIKAGGNIDRILQAGGGAHGHPDGTLAGAKAIRAAAEAALAGISLEEAAANSPELRRALDHWGAPKATTTDGETPAVAPPNPLINLQHKPTAKEFLVAFRVVPEDGVSIESIAANLAIESSTGTWTDVGVDPERIAPFNPTVYSIEKMEDGGYAVKIAYPPNLFESGNIAQIWAAVGGDVFGLKGMKSLRLKDISFSEDMLANMPGPSHGIDGTREQMGLEGRPVLGNIFKPKFGMTIDEMRQLALDAYLGGLDQLKDDEVMTSQPVIDFATRVRAVLSAVKEAEATTGQKKVYVPNVTAPTYPEIAERARLVQSLGGTHILIDGFTAGITTVASLRREFPGLIIQVHRAGHAAMTRQKDGGIDMEVLAKMYRAAGGDLIAVGTPPGIGKMPTSGNDVTRIEDATTSTETQTEDQGGYNLPERWGDMNPSFAVVSGGLHPATIYQLIKAGGNIDRILQAGGGAHGHPDGTLAGAIAIRAAADAALAGISLEEAAAKCPELARALEHWGAPKTEATPVAPATGENAPVLISKANGDPDAAKIREFTDGLPAFALPENKAQMPDVLRSIIEAQVGSTEGLTISPLDNGGLHQGHTGAGIFLVKDAEGHLKYVAKVTTNIEDAVREISGLTLMGALNLEQFSSTKSLGAAKLVGADGTTAIVSLAEGAPGKPLVKLVESISTAEPGADRTKATAHLEAALDAYAKGLAELHDKAPHESGKADTRAYERYFKFNDTTIDQLAASKALPEFWTLMGFASLADLKARVAEVTAAAMANPGEARFIHGDTNPGNEFFAEDGSTTWIDASTVPLGVNEAGMGIAPVGRDITSLAVFLEETVFEVGLPPEEGIRLRTLFEQAYRAYRADFSQASEGDSIRFFEMRAALKALVHTPAAIAAHANPDEHWTPILMQRLDMLARALGRPLSPTGGTEPSTDGPLGPTTPSTPTTGSGASSASTASTPGFRSSPTTDELADAVAYAGELNASRFPTDRQLDLTTDSEAPTGYTPASHRVNLGAHLGPGRDADLVTPNAALSPRAVVAHEIIGHAEAANHPTSLGGPSALAQNRHPDPAIGEVVEEMQASYRAALLADGLSNEERLALIRDGNERRTQLASDEVYVWADEPTMGPTADSDTETLPIDAMVAMRRVLNRTQPDAAEIKNVDVLIEQFAHSAYNWGEDATGALARANGYLQGPVIVGEQDLAFRVFTPIVPGKPPVIAFRGTVLTRLRSVLADMDPNGIGVLQFETNRELIAAQIAAAVAAHGPAVMTGHSLGGALAQMAGAAFPDATKSIVTFASAGVNLKSVEAIRDFNRAHPDAAVLSTHYQMKGDPVSGSAQYLTDGTVDIHESIKPSSAIGKHVATILGEDPELNQGLNLPAAYVRGGPTRKVESRPVNGEQGDPEAGMLELLRQSVGAGVWSVRRALGLPTPGGPEGPGVDTDTVN
jgi:ribulose-bisphosphate carboxylase large chain